MSKPKAVKQPPPPPPVTTTGKDVAYAELEQRKKQRGRAGYQATLLSTAAPAGDKKTLLG